MHLDYINVRVCLDIQLWNWSADIYICYADPCWFGFGNVGNHCFRGASMTEDFKVMNEVIPGSRS